MYRCHTCKKVIDDLVKVGEAQYYPGDWVCPHCKEENYTEIEDEEAVIEEAGRLLHYSKQPEYKAISESLVTAAMMLERLVQ